jgi:hypothetical protein
MTAQIMTAHFMTAHALTAHAIKRAFYGMPKIHNI